MFIVLYRIFIELPVSILSFWEGLKFNYTVIGYPKDKTATIVP